ncbi:unnamed protein product [Soboliphyme baturini]|uniref:Uncharacterized protein n=1 Tax=Soboliphyme baturini TaxID=241478 RepID=A0A183IHF0_9BILA|nr:unnamed protein product [Soboliphyme baturini]
MAFMSRSRNREMQFTRLLAHETPGRGPSSVCKRIQIAQEQTEGAMPSKQISETCNLPDHLSPQQRITLVTEQTNAKRRWKTPERILPYWSDSPCCK